VNSFQLLWVVVGHSHPEETFYELASDKIEFNYSGQPNVNVQHSTHGHLSGAPMERQVTPDDPPPTARERQGRGRVREAATEEKKMVRSRSLAADRPPRKEIADLDYWHGHGWDG